MRSIFPEFGSQPSAAAARKDESSAPEMEGWLRLVEDDTAALRDFQTGSHILPASSFRFEAFIKLRIASMVLSSPMLVLIMA